MSYNGAMMPDLKFKKKSFTLIESVFAIALIALIAITFFSSLLLSVNFVRRSFELRTSSLILQEQMSLIRELKYGDIQSLGGSFASDHMSFLKDAEGIINKSPYEGRDDILKVTLKLAWTAFDNRPENKSIVTLITYKGLDKR